MKRPRTARSSSEQEGGPSQSFPLKLQCMLQDAESKGLTDIVSWEIGGAAFRVHKSDVFVEKIMKEWFNQTKYKSFQRQLNLYGFSRITRGPQKGCYYHPLFQKGRPELSDGINRKKALGDVDDEAELAPSWLADATVILEPTPIQETQAGRNHALEQETVYGFEEYYQKQKSEDPTNATPLNSALERILDSFIGESNSKGTASSGSSDEASGPTKSPKSGTIFPNKLHDMLEYCEQNSMEHIVSWTMEGRAFKVHSIDLFMKDLMPQFFKLTKFESLQRQLNLYCFTRVSRGANKGCYHHPLFVRGGRALSEGMQRRKPDDYISTCGESIQLRSMRQGSSERTPLSKRAKTEKPQDSSRNAPAVSGLQLTGAEMHHIPENMFSKLPVNDLAAAPTGLYSDWQGLGWDVLPSGFGICQNGTTMGNSSHFHTFKNGTARTSFVPGGTMTASMQPSSTHADWAFDVAAPARFL